MYQIEHQRVREDRGNVTDSIVSNENLWYSIDEKNTTDSSTLTIESNPCFRILQSNLDPKYRGSSDARLQKTIINIVRQKQDIELLHPIFSCMHEILNNKDTPAINSE